MAVDEKMGCVRVNDKTKNLEMNGEGHGKMTMWVPMTSDRIWRLVNGRKKDNDMNGNGQTDMEIKEVYVNVHKRR